MAVKKGKKPSADQPNNQSEKDSGKIIPALNEEQVTPNQELENMEVHKHPHHVMHKKKWKEYLLEFLMIFLAIFLGFFAENIREHKVEDKRAMEYAISLVKDLQNDTTSINTQFTISETYISITDSLLSLSTGRLENRNAAKFSFYTRFIYWTVPLSWNRATFEQIKNSGNLRYFTNYQILEKLMIYEAMVNEIEGEFQNHQTRSNILLNEINQIIDPEFHYNLSKHSIWELGMMPSETKEIFFSTRIESLETKRPAINGMLNMAIVQQRNLRVNKSRLLKAKQLANDLRNDLKKEFHIK